MSAYSVMSVRLLLCTTAAVDQQTTSTTMADDDDAMFMNSSTNESPYFVHEPSRSSGGRKTAKVSQSP